MRIPYWLRPFTARLNRTPGHRAEHRSRCRLRVESLKDRTTPSATLVHDFAPGNVLPMPSFVTVRSTLYFAADDGTNGPQVWRTSSQGDAVPVEGDYQGLASAPFGPF